MALCLHFPATLLTHVPLILVAAFWRSLASNSFFALQLVMTHTPFSILSFPFLEYVPSLQAGLIQAFAWHLRLLVSWILGLPWLLWFSNLSALASPLFSQSKESLILPPHFCPVVPWVPHKAFLAALFIHVHHSM